MVATARDGGLMGGGTPHVLMWGSNMLLDSSPGLVGLEKQLNQFPVLKVTVMAFIAMMWMKRVPVLVCVRCRLSQQG